MLASGNISQVLQTAMLIFGILWMLKKVADMERYHTVRVIVLTVLLSYFVVLFFVGYVLGLRDPNCCDCVINFSQENV